MIFSMYRNYFHQMKGVTVMALLSGVRVLDVATVTAAPFAAGLLADFGADVIKIEMPAGGDPFRRLGPYHEGKAMRWATLGRNKRCITLDLRKEEGKELFLQLAAKSDVVIENFRTGTMQKWGLGYEKLKEVNPNIIMSHVTGYGQTGPYAHQAGFGTPATAFSGMTYLTGYKDRPPVSPSFSLTDYVAGLYTAMSTMMALYHRDALHGEGQEVDISLYEGIFRMLEIPIADYDKNGIIRERNPKLSGTSSPGGTYETKDGKWVVMVCSTDRTYGYLTKAMNRPDLLTNPLYATMKDRVANDASLDSIVRSWMGSLNYQDLKEITDREGVPVSLVYSIEDIFNDPHYQARHDIVEMPDANLGTIKMPGVTPVFSATPGEIKWTGPELGAHNKEIYQGLLGVSDEKLQALKSEGVI
jgi:formyl-CoA transferase